MFICQLFFACLSFFSLEIMFSGQGLKQFLFWDYHAEGQVQFPAKSNQSDFKIGDNHTSLH